MITYLVILAALIISSTFCSWAFLPARYLPGNRVRSLRVRLHLRLHPGKGFATVMALTGSPQCCSVNLPGWLGFTLHG